ncbi:hypothetical protein Efla_003395 [Eimeria flavescens]
MKLLACLIAAAGAAVAAAAAEEAESANVTIQEGSEECITAANIVRAARLNTRLGLIERSTELENGTKTMMEEEVKDDPSCDFMEKPEQKLSAVKDMVGFVFKGDNVECLQGMAEAVNKLLAASPGYPPAYDEKKAPWNTTETQVAARVLWQTTKSAGCAYTKGCPNNCVVCKMSEEPQTGKYPFTKEVYEALLARRDAGVDVASLTAADIGKALNSSRGGPWGFSALHCLLLGLLTALHVCLFSVSREVSVRLSPPGETHAADTGASCTDSVYGGRLPLGSSRLGWLPPRGGLEEEVEAPPMSVCCESKTELHFLCGEPQRRRQLWLKDCTEAEDPAAASLSVWPAVHSSLASGHLHSSNHPSFGIHEVLKALSAAMHRHSSQVCQAPAMTPVSPSSAASASFYGASLKGLKYPTYDGSRSQEKVEDFLNVFAVVRSLNSLSDEDLVRFVVHHLRGDALPWWLELSESNRSQHLLDD